MPQLLCALFQLFAKLFVISLFGNAQNVKLTFGTLGGGGVTSRPGIFLQQMRKSVMIALVALSGGSYSLYQYTLLSAYIRGHLCIYANVHTMLMRCAFPLAQLL